MTTDATSPAASVERALDLAVGALRRGQDPTGYWKGDFESSLIGESGEVILRHFLGLPRDEVTAEAAKTILAEQSATGGWASYHKGPDELLLSVFCYVALRLAGHEADEPAMRAAAASIREAGGIEAVDNPTMLAWLSVIGVWPWYDIPIIPPEVILLPSWFPGNIYQVGAAARGIVVANSLFMAERPVTPAGFHITELFKRPDRGFRRLPRPRALRIATRLSHWYNRNPIGFLRRRAVRKAADWLVRTQETDGSWGGNWPQTANVVMGLDTVGYRQDHPVIRKAMAALDGYVVHKNGQRRIEMWTSVVMDTALGVSAAAMSGDPKARESADNAARWLLDTQVTELGDWAVLTKDPVAGGWPYEFVNRTNPDADDTSFAVVALRRLHPRGTDATVDDAVDRACRWMLSQQCDDGGWAAFEPLRWRLPGRDHLAKIGFLEAPSADITGHVLEALGADGQGGGEAARRGVEWLRRNQHEDGSWPGWWACYHLHGTSAAVTGLTACGVPGTDPVVARACDWIEAHQQADGGWGEDIRALRDPAWIGKGESTPSQTGWALIALIAAGRADSDAVRAGLDHLIRTQEADGDWPEPWHTWVVHHDGLYWRDSMLRLIYPIMAMAAYRDHAAASGTTDATGEAR
ncbi:squalene--hopene cyclase [Streptomyces alkaliterrae]|uniref:Squalene--hopene cyclase n=1 Tax=Streptomyces alkaliterrae TaxID=2213162 RepID=A0A5P0YW38_9ACTN|nr:squalene--hopene cyclase [Streptomyces alkaliterrae]MBB1261646.1 squalene--hopene cyclase [Streptomyces alkaliterrae]MQS04506.1 squalene--hopene cyclase [Streptomyces alkaliterrae]